MRILWFTNTASLYDKGKHYYHGGGWIEALEQMISTVDDIQLAVSFLHQQDEEKKTIGKTIYYPIKKVSASNKPIDALIRNWTGKVDSDIILRKLTNVVKDFQPHIIHVFGTEEIFASVSSLVKVPVVIHLQGLLNPYHNTFFGINQSKWNYLFDLKYLKNNLMGNSPVFIDKKMKNQARREVIYLKCNKFVMGRTKWDKLVVQTINPSLTYFHIDEVLREIFYEESPLRTPQLGNPIVITSTISPTVYKGLDVVLKTAKLLKEHLHSRFIWQLVGINSSCTLLQHFEDELEMKHSEMNIQCLGVKNAATLKEVLLQTDLMVHPSYIDNSPNSICEAQMVGVPVIACNVGGISTIIEHGKTGLLVPANGIYELADYIQQYVRNVGPFVTMGHNAQAAAKERHNKSKILADLLQAYKAILS